MASLKLQRMREFCSDSPSMKYGTLMQIAYLGNQHASSLAAPPP